MGTPCPAREPAQPRHCCRDTGTFPSPHQPLKPPHDLRLSPPRIPLPLSPSAASSVSLTWGCLCLGRFTGHDEGLEDPRTELRARLSTVEGSRGSVRVPSSSAPQKPSQPWDRSQPPQQTSCGTGAILRIPVLHVTSCW